MVGMANPASVYCAKLGGKTLIEETAAGERGICVLPNGTEIDEWELFRRDHPAKDAACADSYAQRLSTTCWH